jgi:hypothetical protein
MTTLKIPPGAGGGCLSIAKSTSRVDRRRTGVFPGGMILDCARKEICWGGQVKSQVNLEVLFWNFKVCGVIVYDVDPLIECIRQDSANANLRD